MASEDAQGNLTPEANPSIDNFSEGVNDDEDWDFDGVISGKSAQCVEIKRKLQDLPEECRTKKQKIPTNIAETVELDTKLFRSSDVPVDLSPSSEVLLNFRGDATGLCTESKKPKARMAKLESVETMAFRRHEELTEEVKEHFAEAQGLQKNLSR